MIHPINWPHEGRAAVWFILAFIVYALVILVIARFCEWLGKKYSPPSVDDAAALARAREDWKAEQKKRRLARLLELADDVDSAPLAERQRLYREAEALANDWDSAA